jgi:hypothetical protein
MSQMFTIGIICTLYQVLHDFYDYELFREKKPRNIYIRYSD